MQRKRHARSPERWPTQESQSLTVTCGSGAGLRPCDCARRVRDSERMPVENARRRALRRAGSAAACSVEVRGRRPAGRLSGIRQDYTDCLSSPKRRIRRRRCVGLRLSAAAARVLLLPVRRSASTIRRFCWTKPTSRSTVAGRDVDFCSPWSKTSVRSPLLGELPHGCGIYLVVPSCP